MMMKTICQTLVIVLFSMFTYAQDGKEYATYDDAYSAIKDYSKNTGFQAVEGKYKNCKHLRKATLNNIDESVNEISNRVDISIKWDYSYAGCYIGYHTYTGSAKVKASIGKVASGKYKVYERGVEVLHWDAEK